MSQYIVFRWYDRHVPQNILINIKAKNIKMYTLQQYVSSYKREL